MSKFKALLIDDNQLTQKKCRDLFEEYQIDCQVVFDESEIYAAFEDSDNQFDLLILSISSSVISGYEICQKIRQCEYGENLKIIALSSTLSSEVKAKCIATGIDYYIQSPIEENDFQVALSKVGFLEFKGSGVTTFDELKVNASFEGDRDILDGMIQHFIEEIPVFNTNIEKALRESDFENLMIASHTLKGLLSYFYSDQLRTMAFDLETMARKHKLEEGAHDLFKELRSGLELLCVELRTTYLNEKDVA